MTTNKTTSEFGPVSFDAPQSGTVILEIGTQSVFRIAVFAGTTELGHGSSFVLNHEEGKSGLKVWCLTNRHVVCGLLNLFHFYRHALQDGAPSDFVNDLPVGLRVHFGEQTFLIDSILVPKGEFFKTKQEVHLDFAIFSFTASTDSKLKYFPVAEQKNIVAGAKAFALGYPASTNLSITDGIISRIYQDGDGDKEREQGARIEQFKWGVQHSILINPGNSGGPTVDELGQVVGMSTFGLGDYVGLNFSLNARAILEYISDPKKLEEISVPQLTKKLALRAIESANYG